MNRLSNETRLSGNLGADAEIKLNDKSEPRAILRLAVNNHYTDKTSGESKETTEWFRIVFFGKQAEFFQKHGKKGMGLQLAARLRNRNFDHKSFKNDDGTAYKIYVTDIIGVEFLVTRWPEGEDSAQSEADTAGNQNESIPDDDIPY